ncbi:hypothetical protein [Streptomyces sp. NPDC047009]|uniref:hypothetical protein n=1 Tax=unclassified Streptomyces TaxID=2593676 RepID=UPI0033EE2B0F
MAGGEEGGAVVEVGGVGGHVGVAVPGAAGWGLSWAALGSSCGDEAVDGFDVAAWCGGGVDFASGAGRVDGFSGFPVTAAGGADGVVAADQFAVGQAVDAGGGPQLSTGDDFGAGGVFVDGGAEVAGEFEVAGDGAAAVLGDAQFDGVDGEAVFGEHVAVGEDAEQVALGEVADDLLYISASRYLRVAAA